MSPKPNIMVCFEARGDNIRPANGYFYTYVPEVTEVFLELVKKEAQSKPELAGRTLYFTNVVRLDKETAISEMERKSLGNTGNERIRPDDNSVLSGEEL